MAKKRGNSSTPGQRGWIRPDFGMLTVSKPHKPLTSGKKSFGGRNNRGVITTRHKGSGCKRKNRDIDFVRNKPGVPAKVASIEYDPNRSAWIALLHYVDGCKRYIIATKGMKVGDVVLRTELSPYKDGNCMALKDMPPGSVICCVEMIAGNGAQFARSAGSEATLVSVLDDVAIVRLPSGETRKVSSNCTAYLGRVSNEKHKLVKLGKAGRSRRLGIRPTVRGMAMNPVDHPNGGGEGRSKGGILRSPKGKDTKGRKTRKKSKSKAHLVSARKKRKKR